MVRDILEVIEDKKGSDIRVLDIREVSLLADYFVICTVETDRQLKALVDDVVTQMKRSGHGSAGGVEGGTESGWVLLDFGDVVVHLFSPDKRGFYDLDGLWGDARVVVRVQ